MVATFIFAFPRVRESFRRSGVSGEKIVHEPKKSWRAEMPPRHLGRVNASELTCHEGDVEELVTRTNSELDAKDARIAELEIGEAFYKLSIKERDYEILRCDRLTRERDEALSRAEKAESEVTSEKLAYLRGYREASKFTDEETNSLRAELADRKKYDPDVREVAEYRKGSGAADRLLAAPWLKKGGE